MSQQINLFNPALLKQKQVFTFDMMTRALGLLLAGTLALVFFGKSNVAKLEKQAADGAEQLQNKRTRQAAVMVEFAPRQKSKEIADQIAAAEAEFAALNEVSSVLQRGELGNTSGYAEYFKALARQGGGDLWLTGVSIAGAGNQIGLKGKALEPTLVPAFIKRLTSEPVMQGKSFGSLQIDRAALDGKEGKSTELAPYIDFALQGGPLEEVKK